ncbi:hypothetical protein J2128_001298 [Methanomicrobium sp. W14]|uniref:hypothetical protein n=1 Tax=Methanomicrobium sp. W14 TaxID=2817839 RepID=UPI001AE67F3C|nr:hypothetical protein [Methanomicrobium sp. W14]MBP2133344.1 hypothetical protein [Methanomicrobium sp. W14]
MRTQSGDEAMTGLEAVIAIGILCIFIYLFGSAVYGAVMPDHNRSYEPHTGIISFATGESSEILVVDGACYGAEDTGGVFQGVELKTEGKNPKAMGSCTIPLKLLIGSPVSVKMNKAVIQFSYGGKTENLSYSNESPLSKPSWTIAQKSSVIPFGDADEDNILEQNEIFTILVYPSSDVPASGQFSVLVTPKSENPLVVSPIVPADITVKRIVTLYLL